MIYHCQTCLLVISIFSTLSLAASTGATIAGLEVSDIYCNLFADLDRSPGNESGRGDGVGGFVETSTALRNMHGVALSLLDHTPVLLTGRR